MDSIVGIRSHVRGHFSKGDIMRATRTPRSATPLFLIFPLLLALAPRGATASITPLWIDGTTSRYFVYNGLITPLIGVSDDAGCNLHVGTGSDLCTFDSSQPAYYVNVLNDLSAKNVNKIRLWVSINGGAYQSGNCTTGVAPNAQDQPFVYYPTPARPDGLGVWHLDERNSTFFSNLAQVVAFAQSRPNKIFVEVTFFAPWVAAWELGPWHPNHGRATVGGVLSTVGFTDRAYFVKPDTSMTTGPTNEAMRTYQKKVIDWTVDALASYDNVYFEIANEPESFTSSAPGCGQPTPQTALPADVATWQNSMISELQTYEVNTYVNTGLLTHRHLVSVQPFSTTGASLAFGHADVVNGHYTTIAAANGGMGAITLARTYPTQPTILASNEDKISGTGISGNSATCDATSCSGQPDSARAGAWEFMLDRGGAFDHFGYFYNSAYGSQVRTQMAALKTFLFSLPLRQLVVSPDTPNWVNIGSYTSTDVPNHKYFAALEPSSTAATIKYALYIHRSQPRLKPGTGSLLGFQGYQPIAGTYSESLKLCLGASGTYLAEWISPTTGATLASQTIPWTASSTCANGGPGSVALTPHTYTYDIALRVSKQ
jgi:hypothetical protein